MIPSVSFALLCGALAVVLAQLILNRLPRLNHPAFEIPSFLRATEDRFFLIVEARDANFDDVAVTRVLQQLPDQPVAVNDVKR